MDKLKSIGGILFGVALVVGAIVATVLFFTYGAQVAFTISPFVNLIAGILIVINVVLLLIAIIPGARGVAGIIIYFSSYIYGLSAWIYGLAVTLALWGWIAVIIGLFLGGIGVVPIGMLAAVFNGHWDIFFTLLLAAVLTYAARLIGMLLAESGERHKADMQDGVIEIKENNNRTWKDIE